MTLLRALRPALFAFVLITGGCATRFESILRTVPNISLPDSPTADCKPVTIDTNDEGTRSLLWRRTDDGRCRIVAERLVLPPRDPSGALAKSLGNGPIVAFLVGFGPLRATLDPDLFLSPPDDPEATSTAALVRIHDRALIDTNADAATPHGWFEGERFARLAIEKSGRGESTFLTWEKDEWSRDVTSGKSPLARSIDAELTRQAEARAARNGTESPVDVFDRARRVLETLTAVATRARLLGQSESVSIEARQALSALLPGTDLSRFLSDPDRTLTVVALERLQAFRDAWVGADDSGKLKLVAELRRSPSTWGVAGAAVLGAIARTLGGPSTASFEALAKEHDNRGLEATAAGVRLAIGRAFGDGPMEARGRAQFLTLAKALLIPVELYDEPARVLSGRPERASTHLDRWVGTTESFTGPFPAVGVPGPVVTLRLTRAAIVKHVEEWVATDGTNARASTITKARLISTGTLEGLGERHERKFELAIDDSRDTAEGLERSMNALFAGRVAEFLQLFRTRHAGTRIDARLAKQPGLPESERALERAWLRRVFADDLDPTLAALRGDVGVLAEP